MRDRGAQHGVDGQAELLGAVEGLDDQGPVFGAVHEAQLAHGPTIGARTGRSGEHTPGAHSEMFDDESMQAVRASTSSGSTAGYMPIRSWLRPSAR